MLSQAKAKPPLNGAFVPIALSVFNASAQGARENFRVFYRGTAYDVIIFKFQVRGIAPTPLTDAHGYAIIHSPFCFALGVLEV